MTAAEVIRAAMALTPEERSRVADVLYEPARDEIDVAWASVALATGRQDRERSRQGPDARGAGLVSG